MISFATLLERNVDNYKAYETIEMQKVKISVIVPIYNSERFLEECLDSIQEQDYDNFEVILVDDGSTDSSSVISESFCKKDSRFKLFRKPNEGPSSARNLGIRLARGEYICFIDSDDVVTPNMLSSLFFAITETHSDLAVSKLVFWSKPYHKQKTLGTCTNFITSNDNSIFLKNIFSLKQADLQYNYPGGFSCAKLYRALLIKGEAFPPTKVAEDEIFLFLLAHKIKKVCYVNKELYFYRQNPDSLSQVVTFPIQHLENRYKLLRLTNSETEIDLIKIAIYQSLISYTLGLFYSQRMPSAKLISLLSFYANLCQRWESKNLKIKESIRSKYYSLKFVLHLYRLPSFGIIALLFIAHNLFFLPKIYSFVRTMRQ